MKITLYQNMSENNKIGKVLQNSFNMQGTLKDSCNIMNPIILINTVNVPNYNYMYIDEFKRFYFINSIESYRNNVFIINASIDVLQTYQENILALNAIIDKSEVKNNSNIYYDDGSFVMLNKTFNTIVNFPSGFNDNGEFILITAGG